jgi:cell wall-associated NlpC family hydrolase
LRLPPDDATLLLLVPVRLVIAPPRPRFGLALGAVLVASLVSVTGASADPIDDKKAEAARLEAELEKQGQGVSVLAERYNQARLQVEAVEASLARVAADLSRSEARVRDVRGRLSQVAVLSYVRGGSTSVLSTMAGGAGGDMVLRRQYLRVTAADQHQVLGELRAARDDLTELRHRLAAERASARSAAERAGELQRQAEHAESSQRALLASANGDLAALVAAQRDRREAADAARRREQAAAAANERPAPSPQAQRPSSPAASAPRPGPPAAAALPTSGRGAVAVAEARRQLGKPYVYGGSGPDVFDCSGLTAWAWRAAGVSLSHSAYTQWFETTRVPVDQVEPGDLLFFGPSVKGIHHNAIYIGDGQMIEASQTGVPVRVRGWRAGDLVGAGRPG